MKPKQSRSSSPLQAIWTIGLLFLSVVGTPTSIHAGDAFDWDIHGVGDSVGSSSGWSDPSFPEIVPLPFVGALPAANFYDWTPSKDPDGQWFRDYFNGRDSLGKANAIRLWHRNAPLNGGSPDFPGWDKDALAKIVGNTAVADNGIYPGYIPSLKYVICDFEWNDATYPGRNLSNLQQTVNLLRNAPMIAARSAYVGAYAWYPGPVDLTLGSSTDRSDAHNDYLDSGANLAMPECYNRSMWMRHAAADYTPYAAPNVPAALFWCQIERFSTAQMALPDATHTVIPWVTALHAYTDFTAPLPNQEDIEGQLQHFRMRGAGGYAQFQFLPVEVMDGSHVWQRSGNPWTDTWNDGTPIVPANSWLRANGSTHSAAHALLRNIYSNAWHELDGFFSSDRPTTILNLNAGNAAKMSGVIWSGVRHLNSVRILISNLHTGNQNVNVSGEAQANGNWFNCQLQNSMTIAPGHWTCDYFIDNLLTNGTLDLNAAGWTIHAGSWSSTGGTPGVGCLKLQGGYSALVSETFRVESGDHLRMAFQARAQSGAKLIGLIFPKLKDGTLLRPDGYAFIYPQPLALTDTYATYSYSQIIPPSPNPANPVTGAYVRFFNKFGASDPADVIWIDAITIKFE